MGLKSPLQVDTPGKVFNQVSTAVISTGWIGTPNEDMKTDCESCNKGSSNPGVEIGLRAVKLMQ